MFATVALGMSVNMKDVNTVWHYGAPSSLDNYLQESGRGGCSGEQAKSIIFLKPAHAPLQKDFSINNAEIAAVRHYLENTSECRRLQLLHYYDPDLSHVQQDPLTCCDFCI